MRLGVPLTGLQFDSNLAVSPSSLRTEVYSSSMKLQGMDESSFQIY